MRHFAIIAATLLFATLAGRAEVCLDRSGAAPRISINGQPFIILGGELGNSAATCEADIEAVFDRAEELHLNTLLVPAYWDLTEPLEGKFDFALTDKVIDTARNHGIKVVFLWFGAWKNSMSCYAPEWVKADTKRFPRARTAAGRPLEILSAYSPKVLEADKKAFEAWLRHVDEVDTDNTVLMIQIENEIGMLEDARDHADAANKEYSKGVPAELIKHLTDNKKTLHPALYEKWSKNGMKKSGSWTEVFGDDSYTDEIFMAWGYANYVEQLARVARAISSRPLYVNAALNSRGRRPGEYPSAGPLAHLKGIWHAGAPTLDMLSPDIYDTGFKDWVGQYALPDNALFVPEVRRGIENAAQAYYILGHHDALGISPFAIEQATPTGYLPVIDAYDTLGELSPLIVKYAGTDKMDGFIVSADEPETVVQYGDTKITLSHYFTLPWDPRARDKANWHDQGAILIHLADNEYILAGSGIVAKFEHSDEQSSTATLGEDGFLATGADRGGKQASTGRRIGLATVEEVEILPDGTMKRLRSFNGDETHQGRHVRIGVDDNKILHIKTYKYQ